MAFCVGSRDLCVVASSSPIVFTRSRNRIPLVNAVKCELSHTTTEADDVFDSLRPSLSQIFFDGSQKRHSGTSSGSSIKGRLVAVDANDGDVPFCPTGISNINGLEVLVIGIFFRDSASLTSIIVSPPVLEVEFGLGKREEPFREMIPNITSLVMPLPSRSGNNTETPPVVLRALPVILAELSTLEDMRRFAPPTSCAFSPGTALETKRELRLDNTAAIPAELCEEREEEDTAAGVRAFDADNRFSTAVVADEAIPRAAEPDNEDDSLEGTFESTLKASCSRSSSNSSVFETSVISSTTVIAPTVSSSTKSPASRRLRTFLRNPRA
mmetsp:Transcript_21617/g.34899  ORF Transcript_21617/g.34899 Transcript_21617/m.34899 type:complete len:326 (+) Transcript_21617:57-1034(+)